MGTLSTRLRAVVTGREGRLVLALWATFTWFQHYGPGFLPANESIRLYAAQAVVDYGTLTLDPVLSALHVRNVDRAEFQGHSYLDKAPGLSLAAIPIYAVASRLGLPGDREHLPQHLGLLTALLVALPAALGCAAVRRAALLLETSEWAATFAAVALGLATPYALYATLFFGHGTAAALAAWLLWASLRGRAVAAGLLAGGMVLVETPTAPLALVLTLPLFVPEAVRWLSGAATDSSAAMGSGARTTWPTRLGWFLLGAAPAALAQSAYNAAIFGSPFDFAYGHKATAAFQAIHAHGVFGLGLPSWSGFVALLVSAHRGLVPHGPIVILAALSLSRRTGRVLVGAALGYAVLLSGFADVAGGDAWGPRHLVPALPLIAVAVAIVVDRTPRWMTLGALGASWLVAWLPIATFPYALDAVEVPLAQLGWSLARLGHFAPMICGGGSAAIVTGLALPLGLILGFVRPRGRAVAAFAVGVALAATALELVPPATGDGAAARVLIDCLMGNDDAAAMRCTSAGRTFDARACRCR